MPGNVQGWQRVTRSGDGQLVARLQVTDNTLEGALRMVEELEQQGIHAQFVRNRSGRFVEISPESMPQFDRMRAEQFHQHVIPSEQQPSIGAGSQPPAAEWQRVNRSADGHQVARLQVTPETMDQVRAELRNRGIATEVVSKNGNLFVEVQPESMAQFNGTRVGQQPQQPQQAGGQNRRPPASLSAMERAQVSQYMVGNAPEGWNPNPAQREYIQRLQRGQQPPPGGNIVRPSGVSLRPGDNRVRVPVPGGGYVDLPGGSALPHNPPPSTPTAPNEGRIGGLKSRLGKVGGAVGTALAAFQASSEAAGIFNNDNLSTADKVERLAELGAGLAIDGVANIATVGMAGGAASTIVLGKKEVLKQTITLFLEEQQLQKDFNEGRISQSQYEERQGTFQERARQINEMDSQILWDAAKNTTPGVIITGVPKIASDLNATTRMYAEEDQRFRANVAQFTNLNSVVRRLNNSPALQSLPREDNETKAIDLAKLSVQDIHKLREEIIAARARAQQTVDENSSVLPRWMRGSDSVVKQETARGDVNFYNAALAELDSPDFQERMRAHRAEQERIRTQQEQLAANAQATPSAQTSPVTNPRINQEGTNTMSNSQNAPSTTGLSAGEPNGSGQAWTNMVSGGPLPLSQEAITILRRGERISELGTRVAEIEQRTGRVAPRETDPGFYSYGSEEERRLADIERRLSYIENGGITTTTMLGRPADERLPNNTRFGERTVEERLRDLERRVERVGGHTVGGNDLGQPDERHNATNRDGRANSPNSPQLLRTP